jgi:hypothetical protein
LSILSRSLAIAAVVLATLLLPGRPAHAEYRFLTALSVSEEYNDNIYLQPINRQFDYITAVVPSLGITYKAPLWDWDASFAYYYRYYERADFKDRTYAASLTNLTRIVPDLFFLSLNDTYNRVSLDVTRDFTQQSSFVNQTDQNTALANAYFTIHPGQRTSLNAGYSYQDIWYKDPSAIGQKQQTAYAEMYHSLSSQLTMTIGARFMNSHALISQPTPTIASRYTESDLYAGLRYEYLDGSILFGSIGNIWLRTDTGVSQTQLSWAAGFRHQFPKFQFSFDTALIYPNDPQSVVRREDDFSATIRRDVERTSLSITALLQEFRNALTKHLQATSYTVSGKISYLINEQSKVFADLSIQRLEDNVFDTYTDLYISGVRYEYLARENLTLALEYRYTNSYNPYATESNYYSTDYYNNRLIVEVKKSF